MVDSRRLMIWMEIKRDENLPPPLLPPKAVQLPPERSLLESGVPEFEQSPHFLPTQDGGELAPLLGLGYFLVEPGLFEDAGVEKLEGGEAKAKGGPGQLALIDQYNWY